MQVQIFEYPHPFALEQGGQLPGFQLAYTTSGQLSAARDNVVWVCHALTGHADPASWWPGLFGPGDLFGPERCFTVCANMLGSCYGSTHALSDDPGTGTPYYHRFPLLTNRDMVRAFDLLRAHLGIRHIHLAIGGSMGGQHVLEWAVMRPELFGHLVPVATNAQHSPWGIAWNESQRMAIEADATWREDRPDAGMEGMRAARAMALLSYRSYEGYAARQQEAGEAADGFRASSYQRHQGEKLYRRFNAFSYWTLSKAMDSHHVGRGRGGVEAALAQVRARTLVIGVDSDVLFPVAEQQRIAAGIAGAEYAEITSLYGHDGFLVETAALAAILRRWLAAVPARQTGLRA
ncbi:MAG: homoserine O-acetyltransferase [Bacteroidia bacterium]|nr:homoserine O-acetyltransferase [Bacteroidia bacterium]